MDSIVLSTADTEPGDCEEAAGGGEGGGVVGLGAGVVVVGVGVLVVRTGTVQPVKASVNTDSTKIIPITLFIVTITSAGYSTAGHHIFCQSPLGNSSLTIVMLTFIIGYVDFILAVPPLI